MTTRITGVILACTLAVFITINTAVWAAGMCGLLGQAYREELAAFRPSRRYSLPMNLTVCAFSLAYGQTSAIADYALFLTRSSPENTGTGRVPESLETRKRGDDSWTNVFA